MINIILITVLNIYIPYKKLFVITDSKDITLQPKRFIELKFSHNICSWDLIIVQQDVAFRYTK